MEVTNMSRIYDEMGRELVTCKVCGALHLKSECIAIESPKYGLFYMDRDCAYKMGGYCTESTNKKGIDKKLSITTGVELEIQHGLTNEQYLQLRLLTSPEYGWQATEDCTVKVEYKSPIFNNLNSLPKLLRTVMDNNGGIHHGNGCEASAHINVWSNELDSNDYTLLRTYYEELFADMYDYFYENRMACEKLFGRHMSGWCNGFSNYEHACFINTEECKYDHPRLEFRCSCYRNNKQYMNLLKFCNEVMRILVVNFIRKVHDGKDASHAAKIASNKIMKQVEKYVEKAYAL